MKTLHEIRGIDRAGEDGDAKDCDSSNPGKTKKMAMLDKEMYKMTNRISGQDRDDESQKLSTESVEQVLNRRALDFDEANRGSSSKHPPVKVGDKFTHANVTRVVTKVTPNGIQATHTNGTSRSVHDHGYVQKQMVEQVEHEAFNELMEANLPINMLVGPNGVGGGQSLKSAAKSLMKDAWRSLTGKQKKVIAKVHKLTQTDDELGKLYRDGWKGGGNSMKPGARKAFDARVKELVPNEEVRDYDAAWKSVRDKVKSAMKDQNESVEQVDELSGDKLHDYLSKSMRASDNHNNRMKDALKVTGTAKTASTVRRAQRVANNQANKRTKRELGIQQALWKQTGKAKVNATEEVEVMKEAAGQPTGVHIHMKAPNGKITKTTFLGTHSAVGGAKKHIAGLEKKGHTVHKKELAFAEGMDMEYPNAASQKTRAAKNAKLIARNKRNMATAKRKGVKYDDKEYRPRFNEDAEQVDELSVDTLSRYNSKASKDPKRAKMNNKAVGKIVKKTMQGAAQGKPAFFSQRLQGESVEQVDEGIFGKFGKKAKAEPKKPSNLIKAGETQNIGGTKVKFHKAGNQGHIGYSWKKSNGKEGYEEYHPKNHKDHDAVIANISSEIKYQAKNRNESVEQVDEAVDVAKEIETYAHRAGGIDKKDMLKVASLLKRGDKKAAIKFAKRLDSDPRDFLLSKMNEDAEQVDELSNKLLKRYDRKAATSAANLRKKMDKTVATVRKSASGSATQKQASRFTKAMDKHSNRMDGQDRSQQIKLKRAQKESVEQIDEKVVPYNKELLARMIELVQMYFSPGNYEYTDDDYKKAMSVIKKIAGHKVAAEVSSKKATDKVHFGRANKVSGHDIMRDRQGLSGRKKTKSGKLSKVSMSQFKKDVEDAMSKHQKVTRKLPESVEQVDEGSTKKIGKEIEDYANKQRGIDPKEKRDILKVAAMMKKGDSKGAIKFAKSYASILPDFVVAKVNPTQLEQVDAVREARMRLKQFINNNNK